MARKVSCNESWPQPHIHWVVGGLCSVSVLPNARGGCLPQRISLKYLDLASDEL